MLQNFAISFINMFVGVFNILILARVIMSWINPQPAGGIGRWLFDVTEPVLLPIRRVLPGGAMGLDFSPLVAFLLLQLLGMLANRLATG